jgi:uncharacterized protein
MWSWNMQLNIKRILKPLRLSSVPVLFAIALAATHSAIAAQAASKQAAPAAADHAKELADWRAKIEGNLKRDNGWLTLAGRFVMKPGANRFGTGADNDIVFPAQLKGVGPDTIGTLVVDAEKQQVTLKLADGVSMNSGSTPFTGERAMKFGAKERDWVSLGRISMHVIERNERYVLRLADNESDVRKQFAGRIWYAPNPKFVVQAKFVPYTESRTIPIVNVIDEVSDEPSPGYVEFKLGGKVHRMDVIGDDDEGLFFVFRDATSRDSTYPPSRFLYVEQKPEPNTTFTLDFNRAYNPPCAFSEFTTCPLPPKQNIYKTRIEAGEKYRKKG